MIAVYTKTDCGECENVKRWLKWADIPYQEISGEVPETLAELKKYGFQGFPVVAIEGNLDDAFSGFNYERLKEIKEAYDDVEN